MRICIQAIAMAVSLAASPAFAAEVIHIDEGQLLVQLNDARVDPMAYMHGLKEYRTFFHANLLRYPDQDTDIATEEGVAVVDETIAYLLKQPAEGRIQFSPLLRAAAAAHAADQQRSGGEGHDGSDGSDPGMRVKRLGGGGYVAEVISYGSIDAVDAMRQLIVDDGVADRGHREVIYTSELRYAGAACAPHPRYRTVCVIDLAVTPDGRPPEEEHLRYASKDGVSYASR